MKPQLSDQVRAMAQSAFVKPAYQSGRKEFSISVKELMDGLQAKGFPPNHTPQICSALQTGKFLRPNGLEIIRIDGPKSKTSTTVVFHYRITGSMSGPQQPSRVTSSSDAEQEEPQARSKRLTDKLRGLLKEEIGNYGGADAFIRWVRSEDENAA
jgi:hypothetical protein